MNSKTFGLLCLIAAALILGTVAYHNSQKSQVPIVFSPKEMLTSIWNKYKEHYIEPTSGRTLDPQQNNQTTSEGESYTMLRAVWMDDQTAFVQSWNFTRNNLQQQNSHLFSWLYGKRSDGSYGIRSDLGGQNSASDADSDIALALIFAGSRWQRPEYTAAAKAIIADIWNNEVVVINGKPILAANNVEKQSTAPTIVVDPSYFSPYAYKIFAQLDPSHPWNALIDNSYALLSKSMQQNIDQSASDGLPPDWVILDRTSGTITDKYPDRLTSKYSFDAMRVPWRLALDWEWNQDARAKTLLQDMGFLEEQWNQRKIIDAGYSHDGSVIDDFESPAIYGASLGYFLVVDARDANQIYDTKLRVLYNPDTNSWSSALGYYDDNWAWFGMALYHNLLPNLAENYAIHT